MHRIIMFNPSAFCFATLIWTYIMCQGDLLSSWLIIIIWYLSQCVFSSYFYF